MELADICDQAHANFRRCNSCVLGLVCPDQPAWRSSALVDNFVKRTSLCAKHYWFDQWKSRFGKCNFPRAFRYVP